MVETADIATLFHESAWLRRLAMSLVRDDAEADDLVQETWVLALRHPPRAGQTVRPWLAEVLRNVMRARFRSAGRRARREDASVDKDAQVTSPEELLGAVESQRKLADEVIRLAEPYRTTLLMVFYDGLTPTEIATRERVPAGTVRWRLKEGLALLRAQLDRGHGGDRNAWKRALMPLAAGRLGRVTIKTALGASLKGSLVMKLALVAVIAVGLSVAPRLLRPQAQPLRAPSPAVALQAAPVSPAAPARVDKSTRVALEQRIDAALHAAHPSAAPPPIPPLDPGYVAEQMRGLVPLVLECFDNALARHPDLRGTVTVGFSIFGDPSVGGLVGGSQIIDAKSTLTDPEVRECIQETMYAAKFPPPPEGGEVHVEYPFVFAPKGEITEALTPEQRQRLETMLATGKLPDGTPLTQEQMRHLEMVRLGREPLGRRVEIDE
jgi:RNA polymerase sigma factor (sigma-70 family)